MRTLGFRSIISLSMAVVVSLSHIDIVQAIGFQAPPAISNKAMNALNISFTGGGSIQNNGACASTSSTLPGTSNPERAFIYFISKGFTDKQVAGIIGNFIVESGVNPKRVQGSGVIESETLPTSGGYGIAQWDDRKSLLKSFATSDPQKRPIYDLSLQLDFVMHELNTTEKAAFDAFKPTNTIQSATTVWMERYERPGKPALGERIKASNKAFGDFAASAGNQPTIPTVETSTTCAGSGTIVGIAQAELAKKVLEDPIGCDAPNLSLPGDCGPEVNKYTDSRLEYWCADFVSWVYKQAGTPFTGGSSGGWRIPSVEGVQAYLEKNGTFYENSSTSPDPRPGDVYVINNGEHIGIVVKVEDGKLYGISGNTSTENFSNGVGVGDAVYSNYKSDPSITGYGGLR